MILWIQKCMFSLKQDLLSSIPQPHLPPSPKIISEDIQTDEHIPYIVLIALHTAWHMIY